LEPALDLRESVRIVCLQATADQLVARLATHELEAVLSDSPMDPSLKIRAYSHLLGECGVTFAVGRRTAVRYRHNFPQCLNGARPSFESKEGSRQSAQPMTYERSSTPLAPSESCSIPQLSPFATLPGGNCSVRGNRQLTMSESLQFNGAGH